MSDIGQIILSAILIFTFFVTSIYAFRIKDEDLNKLATMINWLTMALIIAQILF